jgi:hypothetical protein
MIDEKKEFSKPHGGIELKEGQEFFSCLVFAGFRGPSKGHRIKMKISGHFGKL